MSATFEPLGKSFPRPTLASAAMPKRVRRVLEHLYALVSDEMARALDLMLIEYEQQLFRQADQARNPSLQSVHLETLRLVRLNRVDLVPRYLVGLETALTKVREPVVAAEDQQALPTFRDLRLVDDREIDEHTALRTIATRQETRAGLPLMLLGQRFGVLAGAPAYDAERLPLGPHSLGRILAEACSVLQIGQEAKLDLYRIYDVQVMAGYAQLVETMNALLARENVLPSLSFVPIRARPTAQNVERGEDPRSAREDGSRGPRGARPYTAWTGQTDVAAIAAGGDEGGDYASLQQLLSGRRDLLGKLRPGAQPAARPPLPTDDLIDALRALQATPAQAAPPQRSVSDLRQTLLAQARQQRGEAATLSREDSDAFELLDLFYGEIERELRGDAATTGLLGRLQVPLLRLALQDRAFFVRSQHPARQLLNAVAEAGASWIPKEESDPQLNEQLRRAVDHVVEHYDGDATVFEAANQSLQDHLRTMARKAEVAERRHVEAARGKEKLEMAKQQAGEAIQSAVHGQALPKFVQALLTQAWSDVLTLTLLRHGEESDEWRRQVEATRQIVAANVVGASERAPGGLDGDIEHALTLVGYHADEANAISRQLTVGATAANDDVASRTELAMKLKARARLGEDNSAVKRDLPPRGEQEQICWEHIRTLPFGTWFEFVVNQQGDAVRRRLSWFSTVTDNALFVNQRGQRIGEQSLDSLARMMAQGQARVVTAEKGRLVDRAWNAALGVLRGFVGGQKTEEAQA
ncbi:MULTISPECIES: DUF1631 domain-containing protein [unclassified Lysobacter]|uniref:DUF1631 domain-containing protein n=1 Tax=unclassified Lysobacter TaxID=2635362 RepID=UPI0006FB28AF|nr:MULTISPECIES: DUF1631 domain-containing protein [unclassified Lysobacter]KRA15045.1 hypothetical protein ASD69_19510 [Lysobacter sp. Root604]KRD30067.1 hypothetical protein ASE35_18225 [Lysobacter sp. Root916]KRD75613.1 hypothetical protein ASE43_12180 [Lysobacter sp. Root983]